ncbi:hypothetical protein KY284_034194 [Solanum tuberosum]|nr:hypothetical protein KY284_034194 [Solanum tuberosum]
MVWEIGGRVSGERIFFPVELRPIFLPSIKSPAFMEKAKGGLPNLDINGGPISRTCLVCPPFFDCPARFTGLLAYQALARCSRRPLGGRSAHYPDFSLCWGPPIARAISYISSSSQPQGPAPRGQSGLSDLERYYKSSVPDSIAAAIWFAGTTKKSHAYVTVIDGLIILGGMVLPATFGVVISAASGCRPSTILALKIRQGGDIK